MALTDNIVSYWKLDESSGNASDSVGSNTLTNVGTATYGAGLINNGVILNGLTQWLINSSPSGTSVGTGAFTVAGWFKQSVFTTLDTFFDVGTNGANNHMSIGVESSTVIRIFCNGVIDTTVSTMSTGVWNQLAVTFSGAGNTASIYVNNVSVASSSTISPNITGGYVSIGTNFGGDAAWAFGGNIDEVGFWSRELSGAEISSLYNGGAGIQYPFAGPVSASSLLTTLNAG